MVQKRCRSIDSQSAARDSVGLGRRPLEKAADVLSFGKRQEIDENSEDVRTGSFNHASDSERERSRARYEDQKMQEDSVRDKDSSGDNSSSSSSSQGPGGSKAPVGA